MKVNGLGPMLFGSQHSYVPGLDGYMMTEFLFLVELSLYHFTCQERDSTT